jgi:hypothetical protein
MSIARRRANVAATTMIHVWSVSSTTVLVVPAVGDRVAFRHQSRLVVAVRLVARSSVEPEGVERLRAQLDETSVKAPVAQLVSDRQEGVETRAHAQGSIVSLGVGRDLRDGGGVEHGARLLVTGLEDRTAGSPSAYTWS